MTTLRTLVRMGTHALQLQVAGLEGIPSPDLILTSPDGKWSLKVPRSVYHNMDFPPGTPICINLALFHATVDVPPEPLAGLDKPQLILPPKGMN